jgi:ubiquinone biosynthesis accessory factor UbiJ
MAAVRLLRPFESLVNRNLRASTPARALLAELAGRSFAIQVETPIGGRLMRLRLAAAAEGLAITAGDEPADASVTGSPLGLAALVAGRSDGRFTAAGVAIAGDAEVAGAFEKLLRYARPEFEEELARLVGDVPAHYAARAARGAADWGRRALDSIARNVGEYLIEEGRDVVSHAELESFHSGVDRIREDVDRAEARLALVAARRGRLAR